jgi:ATP-dependent RNA helicase SUPV3L1/SUV3
MRRLRENAILETEITKTGDLIVEGHVIGHLSGFEFAPADSSSEPDAKALRGAAQKVLASEIEARAKRLADSADAQFVLAADGTIRWTGEPVARLIAGENALEPRFRILADEQLTGPARDSVETRLALWLKTHIEKLLGPLVALGKAEDVTGIARGVAFQLVEALGVLERQKVAEEVKGLDQTARAGLRAHGIRFGAHHIYMPLLLKPAPRALSLLLWGLKHGGLGQKGISELPALAASGRTSMPLDPEIAKPLYRAVGYRVCGARALRVDILERLADLIRPALSWRPGMPGEKPAGTADGRGFTVTVAMTSLVGCAGEDFAHILRALGYRMERRPAPPPEVKPEVATDAAPAPDATAAVTAAEAAPAILPAADPLPETASAAAPIQPEPAVEALAEAPSEAALQPTEAAPAAAASAEPAMIEVWRPGRPQGERRAPRRHERERRVAQASALPAAVDAAQASAPPAPQAKRDQPHRHQSHKRERPERDRRPARAHRPDREPRPPRERNRERPVDPNSPFAALLELKARLEAAQKNES